MTKKRPWLSSNVRCQVTKKERFTSEKAAIHAIISRKWISNTHRCRFCGGWHITERPLMAKTQDTPRHATLRKALAEQRTSCVGSISARRKLHRCVLDGKQYTFEYNKNSRTIVVQSIEESHEADPVPVP